MFVNECEISGNVEVASEERGGTFVRLVFEFPTGRYEPERRALENEFVGIVLGYRIRESVVEVFDVGGSEIVRLPGYLVEFSEREGRERLLTVGEFVFPFGKAEFQTGIFRYRSREFGFPGKFPTVRQKRGRIEVVSEKRGEEPLGYDARYDGHGIEMAVEHPASGIYRNPLLRRYEHVGQDGIGFHGYVH